MDKVYKEGETALQKEPTHTRLKKILNEKVRIREELALKANKDVTQSIDYAKRIQEAVLPDKNKLHTIFRDHFIFYQPKDIVSGDFFWFEKCNDISVIAIADCTGHGVPGGFMSMLGVLLLNFIVIERGITAPDEILCHLHKELRKTLRQYEDSAELPDGMDMSVCTIDRNNNILRFAGANHSLFVSREKEIQEIPGDKYGIGGLVLGIERVFTGHEIHIEQGSRIYFSTDGFKDQFGGERNKKFSKRKFVELLQEISIYPVAIQKIILEETFHNWKTVFPQTDDVLVLAAEL
jgi:serine phosphatase RsbU (regulator of sigma subunit)